MSSVVHFVESKKLAKRENIIIDSILNYSSFQLNTIPNDYFLILLSDFSSSTQLVSILTEHQTGGERTNEKPAIRLLDDN